MQRTPSLSLSLSLAVPLLFAACTAETSSESSSDSSSGTNSAASSEAGSETAAALPGENATPAAQPTSRPAAPPTSAPTEPAVTLPPSDFDPGGPVTDEHLKDYHVVLTCAVDGEDVGTMTVALWGDEAPITVRNFLRLSDQGFYDGLTFHRILRDFMVQGGDPTGSGGGNSPHGTIQAEFSDAPERAHRYGVLSMARLGNNPDSASCQFFICSDDGSAVWNLDGNYSSFGRITSGAATLEALADVETGGREGSTPTVAVTITRAEVREGAAPGGETIARPEVAIDLGGAPPKVVVQHVLISFAGIPRIPATRSKEEAQTLAQEVLQKAKDDEDFEALVRAHSDDPIQGGDTAPGVYKLLNEGVRDRVSERRLFELSKGFQGGGKKLELQQQNGEITLEELQASGRALQIEAQRALKPLRWMPRGGMVPSFGDVAFSLGVGEVGIAEYDEKNSPFGWHVIKRLE